MPTYTWTFAQSFLVFLCIVLFAQSAATFLRAYLPMPLLFGALFAAGFHFGLLPKDLLLSSNMVAVGTIAFHVLVIHSGTLIDLKRLRAAKKQTLVCVGSALGMTAGCLLILPHLIGGLALLAPGAVVGGGATCAIGSRWVASVRPEWSFFPWMIFMFQGVFCVPVVSWALRKETARRLSDPEWRPAAPAPQAPGGLCAKIPAPYKTPAYYLFLIMLAAVLNFTMQNTILKNLGINLNVTALLLGLLLGNTGLMDRGPLFRADSYGLLILSLMGLMANNLAETPLETVWSLLPAVLISLCLGTALLVLFGFLLSKWARVSPYLGILLSVNSVMGFPVNRALAARAASAAPESQRKPLAEELAAELNMSTVVVSGGFSVLLISILVSFIR